MRTLTYFTAAAIALSLGTARAEGNLSGKSPQEVLEHYSSGSGEAVGRVTHFDRAHGVMTIEVLVPRDATVERDGTSARLDDIKPGDSVRASFVPGTNKVDDIQLLSKDQREKTAKAAAESGTLP